MIWIFKKKCNNKIITYCWNYFRKSNQELQEDGDYTNMYIVEYLHYLNLHPDYQKYTDIISYFIAMASVANSEKEAVLNMEDSKTEKIKLSVYDINFCLCKKD